MRAVVLAFACAAQYHLLRSTASAGYEVHILGKDCAQGLKHSRYCKSFREFTFNPKSDSLDDALEEIKRHCKKLRADIILPSDIISTRLLIALSDRLPLPTCALPDADCFDTLNDKHRFYEFCVNNNVRVPHTHLFADLNTLKNSVANGELKFPFIAKPLDSMGGFGVYKITGENDLKILDKIDYKPILAQKLISGQELDISVVADRGHIVAYSIQRNLPGKYHFIEHPQILEQVERIIKACSFNGIANFDVIEEEAGGDCYIIECNPRAWYSIFATTIAGLNFVELNINRKESKLDAPLYVKDKEVRVGNKIKTVIGLIKQMPHFSEEHKTDLNYLRYILADPIGKKYARSPEYNDLILPPSAPGSIRSQAQYLEAITLQNAQEN